MTWFWITPQDSYFRNLVENSSSNPSHSICTQHKNCIGYYLDEYDDASELVDWAPGGDDGYEVRVDGHPVGEFISAKRAAEVANEIINLAENWLSVSGRPNKKYRVPAF